MRVWHRRERGLYTAVHTECYCNTLNATIGVEMTLALGETESQRPQLKRTWGADPRNYKVTMLCSNSPFVGKFVIQPQITNTEPDPWVIILP